MIRSPPEGSLILEECGCKGDSVVGRDRGQVAELFHLENPCFQGFGFLSREWRWAVRFDARLGRGCVCSRIGRDSHDLLLLLLDFVMLVDDLLSESGQLCLEDLEGVTLVLGHVVLGFFLWGFLDRAPRSRVLGSSEFKVAQLSSKSGESGIYWMMIFFVIADVGSKSICQISISFLVSYWE